MKTKLFIITLVGAALIGCSSMPGKLLTQGLLPKPEAKPLLDVETTVGTKQEAVVGSIDSIGSKNEVKSENITGGVSTNYIQQVPITFMLLMILGWLMPTPGNIWKGFVKLFKREDVK